MTERTKRTLSGFSMLLAVAVPCLCGAGPTPNASAEQKRFLWRAEGARAEVFLFGSLHFGRKDMYPLPARVQAAFRASDTLVVEADIEADMLGAQAKILLKALYPQGRTAKTELSPEMYAKLAAWAQANNRDIEQVGVYRPWFLMTVILGTELQKMGLRPESGIDKHFLGLARGRKRILELESVDFQLDLLSGLSKELQELLLAYTLQEVALIRAELDALVAAWRNGDAGGMDALLGKTVGEHPALVPLYEKLFYERNESMTAKIEGYLGTDTVYFVVVGAGHLVGEKGIVALLRKKGYRVEQQ